MVKLICTNPTIQQFELSSVETTFIDLVGKGRKKEKANLLLDLVRLFAAATWGQHFVMLIRWVIILFTLEWTSKDPDHDYENCWLKEWESWSFGGKKKLKRHCCAAVLLVDLQPCLVVYYKNYDPL
jgi:hypothetical protein